MSAVKLLEGLGGFLRLALLRLIQAAFRLLQIPFGGRMSLRALILSVSVALASPSSWVRRARFRELVPGIQVRVDGGVLRCRGRGEPSGRRSYSSAGKQVTAGPSRLSSSCRPLGQSGGLQDRQPARLTR